MTVFTCGNANNGEGEKRVAGNLSGAVCAMESSRNNAAGSLENMEIKAHSENAAENTETI